MIYKLIKNNYSCIIADVLYAYKSPIDDFVLFRQSYIVHCICNLDGLQRADSNDK